MISCSVIIICNHTNVCIKRYLSLRRSSRKYIRAHNVLHIILYTYYNARVGRVYYCIYYKYVCATASRIIAPDGLCISIYDFIVIIIIINIQLLYSVKELKQSVIINNK